MPAAPAPAAAAQLTLPARSGCPIGVRRLVLAPGRPLGAATGLSDLVVCRDVVRGEGFVRNGSEEVWLIDSPFGLEWADRAPTPSAAIFRAALPYTLSVGLAIEPGTQAYFQLTDAADLHLTADPRLQSMWEAQKATAGEVVGQGQDAVVRLLSGDSTTRRAVLVCALAGYRIGSQLSEAPSESPEKQLTSGLEIGESDRECRTQIRLAQSEARSTGVPALVSTEETLRVVRSPSWLGRAGRGLTTALTRVGGRLRL